MKTRMAEPWEEWDAHCRKEEERAAGQEWPECAMCGAEITEDHHYIFDDDHVCENCITDYVIDNHRMQTVPDERF